MIYFRQLSHQMHYRYVISRTSEDSYNWKSLPRWSHCDKICKGKQYSKPVCVHQSTGREVEEDLCSYLGPRYVKIANNGI